MGRRVMVVVLASALIASAACSGQTAGHGRAASTGASFTSPVASAATPTVVVDARQQIAAAEVTARTTGKRVLLDFGADWCPDCRVLDQLYTSPTVAPILSKDYVLVHVDVGHFDQNMDLSTRYGRAANVGIPALVVLGGDGRMYVSTSDGSFDNARTMEPSQVAAFLRKWAPV